MKKYFLSILIVLLAALSFLPRPGLAAEVVFEPSMVAVPHPQKYTVTLLIDTQGESINAIEGSLSVNPSAGAPLAVSDSGSIITYWIDRAEWNSQKKTVDFRGAIPGGFVGKGILFSIVMPKIDTVSVTSKPLVFTNFRALRNDGLGSQARVSFGSFALGQRNAQVADAINGQLYIEDQQADNVPPEVFSPQIARDGRVFDGQWFITFSTQDKQSGIDHYEIQESRSGRISAGGWKQAESPYLLEDQELHSYVFVLAIDRQGNERVIKVYPRYPLPWTERYGRGLFIFGGVILLVAAALIAHRSMRKTGGSKKV